MFFSTPVASHRIVFASRQTSALKTSAWDRRGIICSIRPDHLSYVVKVDNRFFIRPCRLLQPVTLENCSPPTQAPTPISPSLPRRSERLQLWASAASVHTSASVSSTFATSSPHQVCSAMDKQLSTTLGCRSSSKSGRGPTPQLLSPHRLWSSRTRTIFPSQTKSPTSPAMSTWINRTTDSHSLTCTGPASAPASPQYLRCSLPCSLSRGAATCMVDGSASHALATQSF